MVTRLRNDVAPLKRPRKFSEKAPLLTKAVLFVTAVFLSAAAANAAKVSNAYDYALFRLTNGGVETGGIKPGELRKQLEESGYCLIKTLAPQEVLDAEADLRAGDVVIIGTDDDAVHAAFVNDDGTVAYFLPNQSERGASHDAERLPADQFRPSQSLGDLYNLRVKNADNADEPYKSPFKGLDLELWGRKKWNLGEVIVDPGHESRREDLDADNGKGFVEWKYERAHAAYQIHLADAEGNVTMDWTIQASFSEPPAMITSGQDFELRIDAQATGGKMEGALGRVAAFKTSGWLEIREVTTTADGKPVVRDDVFVGSDGGSLVSSASGTFHIHVPACGAETMEVIAENEVWLTHWRYHEDVDRGTRINAPCVIRNQRYVPDLATYPTRDAMTDACRSEDLEVNFVTSTNPTPSKEQEFSFEGQNPTVGMRVSEGTTVEVRFYGAFAP